MLSVMRRRTPGPVPDVFETFADRVDSEDEAPIAVPAVGVVARSAGVTVGLMVLTCVAFVGGAWAANTLRPDLQFSNLLWEGVVILGWAVLWGALAAAATLAAGFLVVGLPWVRRQRGSRATSTSEP
jgi:hypothetical protein